MTNNARPSIDRSAARRYFIGAGRGLIIVGCIILFLAVVAGFNTPLLIIGVLSILAGIVWGLVVFLSAPIYENQVDEIINIEKEYLLQRGAEKLSLVEEQTNIVAPLQTVGVGHTPTPQTQELERYAMRSGGFFRLIGNVFVAMFSSIVIAILRLLGRAVRPPMLRLRFGRGNRVRASLIQVNIFMFGESQVYVYFANLDIVTGYIYHEGTHEFFYSDVNSITTDQKIEARLNLREFAMQDIVFEFVKVYTPGWHIEASFDPSITGVAAVLDEQFTAMRNLIREKKDAN